MRVAFLSVSSELGGSETSLLLLVQNIRRLQPDWRLTIVRCRAKAHSRVAYARPTWTSGSCRCHLRSRVSASPAPAALRWPGVAPR